MTYTYDNKFTYYHLAESAPLRLPSDRFGLSSSTFDGKLRVFDEVTADPADLVLLSSRLLVYDTDADSVRFELAMPLASYKSQFLPDNRLAVVSNRYGVSSYVIDLDSGQVTHQQSPFRWVAWAMPLLFLSFLGWATLWLRVPARSPVWLWCDIALLSALALLPLMLRLFAVGSPTDLDRPPYNYSQGMFLALYQVSVAWLVFGNSRLTLRYIPTLLVLTALAVTLTCVLGTDRSAAAIVADALVKASVLALAMCLVAGLVRLLGWRLLSADRSGSVPLRSGKRITMRDPLIALTLFALVAAVLRPVAPGYSDFEWSHVRIDMLAGVVACTFAGGMLALTPRRVAFWSGMFAFSLLSVLLVAQPTYEFVLGWYVGLGPSKAMVYFRVIGAASLATYIFALAYRFRGWRLIRLTALASS